MHRAFRQADAFPRLAPQMADHDYALRVHHHGLPPSKFADARRYLVDGLLGPLAGILRIVDGLVDGPHCDFEARRSHRRRSVILHGFDTFFHERLKPKNGGAWLDRPLWQVLLSTWLRTQPPSQRHSSAALSIFLQRNLSSGGGT